MKTSGAAGDRQRHGAVVGRVASRASRRRCSTRGRRRPGEREEQRSPFQDDVPTAPTTNTNAIRKPPSWRRSRRRGAGTVDPVGSTARGDVVGASHRCGSRREDDAATATATLLPRAVSPTSSAIVLTRSPASAARPSAARRAHSAVVLGATRSTEIADRARRTPEPRHEAARRHSPGDGGSSCSPCRDRDRYPDAAEATKAPGSGHLCGHSTIGQRCPTEA